MKKFISLALVALLLLPVLPLYASDAERTVVEVANYNNIAEDLLVTVIASDGFIGGSIMLGDKISQAFTGNGAGIYPVSVNLSSLDKAGAIPLEVTADYGLNDSDVIEKTINVSKMNIVKTNYVFDALTTTGSAPSAMSKVDNNTAIIQWSGAAPTSHTYLKHTSTAAVTDDTHGMTFFEFEVLFKNGTSDIKETPGVSFFTTFRQDASLNNADATGVVYPYNSQTNSVVTGNDKNRFELFKDNGTIVGSGANYYTNVWYKVKYVIDAVTTSDEKLVGGITLYIAEDNGNGYGDYKFVKKYDYYTFNNIQSWRLETYSSKADVSATFKNVTVSKQIPLDAWYLNNTLYDGNNKLTLEFSEDLGTLTTKELKLFNKISKDDGSIICEEIPVSAITALESGKYDIELKKSLLYGKDYDILLINAKKSLEGSVAYKEPLTDENKDGFWTLTTFAAPDYPVSIAHVTEGENLLSIEFSNTDITDKYCAVCWYDAFGSMVDICIKPLNEVSDGDVINFARSNTDNCTSYKIIVFGLDTIAESSSYGISQICDIK